MDHQVVTCNHSDVVFRYDVCVMVVTAMSSWIAWLSQCFYGEVYLMEARINNSDINEKVFSGVIILQATVASI